MSDSTTVGVVGLGYVGLPLAMAFAESGYDVVGVDVDERKIKILQEERSTLNDVPDSKIERHLGRTFDVSTTYDKLSDVDAVSICVPTPIYEDTEAPDISYLTESVDRLVEVVAPGTTIIVESTVYPGATDEVVTTRFNDAGFRIGDTAFVAYSPERIDPGNEEYEIREIPKVLGGVTRNCGDRAEALYSPVFEEIVRVDSTVEAELVKLLENTFRAVNIAFVNELAIIAHSLDVDVWETIEAAATKPFGFMPFYPGPGFGGHCIPIDPAFLSWKAHKLGVETRFIELAARINHRMPRFVISRVEELLSDQKLNLSDSEVMVLGVAYKPGVEDTRESPAHEVIALLEQAGAEVAYHDPYVPTFRSGGVTYESIPLDDGVISSFDCIVLLTDHPAFDIEGIVESATLFFDTRNATKGIDSENIHRL